MGLKDANDVLFYDTLTGLKFRNSIENVMHMCKHINEMIDYMDRVSISEYCRVFGLDESKLRKSTSKLLHVDKEIYMRLAVDEYTAYYDIPVYIVAR